MYLRAVGLSVPLLGHSRQWRAKQQEEIRKRDEASDARRDEAIAKAERAIDKFYEDYNSTKEKNIKANK